MKDERDETMAGNVAENASERNNLQRNRSDQMEEREREREMQEKEGWWWRRRRRGRG